MSADATVSRELKSLQDELSVSQRQRISSPPPPGASATSGSTAAPPSPQEIAEEHELRAQLSEFMDEVKGFFAEAEKNITAHPTESVVAALVLGILIGRLLGRR